MQITINGEQFQLDRKEVAVAKKLALEQMKICREKIDAVGHPSLYITYLLMLHILSQDALNAMDEKVIANALSCRSENNW